MGNFDQIILLLIYFQLNHGNREVNRLYDSTTSFSLLFIKPFII